MTPTTSQPSLASGAMADLRAYFADKQHNPSAAHWDALGDVVGTLDAMAGGTCTANVFLAALDPGVGKSSAVLAFARALGASAAHSDVGMIVCVGRVAEAVTMAGDLARVGGASFAVLTSDEAANALSTATPNEAQVLITTQQRIERATDNRDFGECGSFHYHGAPRSVRAWDEAWLPGVTVSLTGDDLLGVVGLLRRHSGSCADAVAAFGVSLGSIADGAAVEVLDYEAAYGLSFHAILAETLRDDQRTTVAALAALCGKTARVCRNGIFAPAMLTYKDTLPDDLAPLLVLDASGRVRETYRLIETHRGGLVRLKEAVKDYGPLNVHVWERAGSKSGWGTSGDELVAGIAETIQERPAERWLVVAHKAGRSVKDVGSALKRKLSAAVFANVQVITWGNHMASNLYADFPNVILAGTLFMPNSHYTALTHLAQDRSVSPGLASKDDVDRTTQGEHANLILQALCRGRVRKSDGDRCLPMNAYVIASKRSGIPDALRGIFPGCAIHPWRKTIAALPDQLSRALDFIKREVATGALDMPNSAIMAHLSIDRSNFTKRVLNHPRWADVVGGLGVVAYPKRGRRPGGFKLHQAA